jgi:A/G-specific adenine glycosylase
MNQSERIHGFSEAIWEWYGAHKRMLPWRDMKIDSDTQRAYRVMVSEVMLQQTQVSRVIIVFRDFLERFNKLEDLAQASNSDVIMAWRGMGYNSRALRLRDAARSIVKGHDGIFPREMNELLSIKGLGPYTAAAIRNFAFTIPTPCIDTNIRRILHRTFVGPENADGTWEMSDKELLKIAQEILTAAVMVSPSNHDTANWHAALMDYGSFVQTKNNPKWSQCILTERGLMKTTPRNWIAPVRGAAKEKLKREPGRMVGSMYIPNRIFRGKIVEALRDSSAGLSEVDIGRQICIDWQKNLEPWLKSLINKLIQEEIIARKGKMFVLAE